MEIFKLFGSIMVDNEKANKSISDTDKKAGGLADKLSKGVGTAAKWGAGLAAASAGVGAAVLGAANKAAQAADEIDKGSIRMGISTDKYQEFRYAAGQCGVEMGTLEKAAKKLEGTDINLDDAMKSIMALTTEEERSAKAAELFGESVAYQMAPLLAQSGEEFDALTERAHDLGLVMDESAVSAGVAFGDALSDVKQSLAAVGTQIGAELMPVAMGMVDFTNSHMPEIQAVIHGAMEIIGNVIQALIPVIVDLYGMVEQYLPAIKQFFSDAFVALGQLWETILKPALQAIIDFCATSLFPGIKKAFEDLQPVIQNVFEAIKNLWENTLKPVFTGIIDFITGVFSGDWEKAFQGLSKIVEGVFNGMKELVKVPLNAIIDMINKFFASLGSIDIPDWVPGIGGQTFSMPQIPRLAKGGTIVDDGTVMVGEAGAELLQLGKGASVIPLSGAAQENSLTAKMDAILDMMAQYMPLIGSNIVLNNGALVGSMASEMDRALGRVQTAKARGV